MKPLSSIELRQLRYFLAAAEHGSFRKASIALAVQESSISRRIRDLEDQLGASLFQRHSGGVFLTQAGQRFSHQARAAMQHLGEGAKEVDAIGKGESGHIEVGILSPLASGFLCSLFRAFDADRPGVRVAFSDGVPSEHVAAVRLHQLDIAFIAGTAKYAGCESTPLWSERVFAVLPVGHRLAEQQLLEWRDMLGERFIVSERALGREMQDVLVGRLAGLGQYPEVYRQNVSRDNLMSLVAMGCGITLTSEAMTSIVFKALVYRPITREHCRSALSGRRRTIIPLSAGL